MILETLHPLMANKKFNPRVLLSTAIDASFQTLTIKEKERNNQTTWPNQATGMD